MSKKKVFVIMPFDAEFDALYLHLKSIVEEESFEVFRADDLLNQQNILKDIVVSINNSDLIIADLTGLNPNVFYELGLAHALRKNVILLTQEIEELPFDLRSYRATPYSTHFSRIRELEVTLKKMCNDISEGKLSFGSPVTDWIPIESQKRSVITIPEENDDEPSDQQDTSDNNLTEERGFIDFVADMEESLSNLTILVSSFSDNTEQIGSEVSEISGEIQKAWERPSSGTASHVRKLARKLATKMNDYGLAISKQNLEYERQWIVFEDSITNLVVSPIVGTNPDNIEGLSTFLITMDSVKDSIISARDGISFMADSVTSVKGFESTVTRAAVLIEREIQTLIGLLDRSISTLNRVLEVGREQVRQNKHTNSGVDIA